MTGHHITKTTPLQATPTPNHAHSPESQATQPASNTESDTCSLNFTKNTEGQKTQRRSTTDTH